MTPAQEKKIKDIEKNLSQLEKDFEATQAPHMKELISSEKDYLTKCKADIDAQKDKSK